MMTDAGLVSLLGLLTCACAFAQSSPLHEATPFAGRRPHPKKGCCQTAKAEQLNWRSNVAALDVSWHYSWGARLPGDEPSGVAFVPMIWGFWGANDGFLGHIRELTVAAAQEPLSEPLLAFNEPDNKQQANLSVSRALEAWPYLMQTRRRLGSPGAVHADGEWMREFMAQAELRGYRVDFVCVHWYGGPHVEGLLNHLKKVHDLYGKPIWLTEFAVADWKAESIEQNRFSSAAVLAFMQEVLPKLDALDFVERYAWFSGMETDKALGSSALFKADGSLTPLGQFYAGYQQARP